MDWTSLHKIWDGWASNNIGSSGEPLKAALLINYDPAGSSRLLSIVAEQEGSIAKPLELVEFLDFFKHSDRWRESFFIGPNQYLVTTIHEKGFCARCINTSKPAGEGVIVIQTTAFLLVGMYDGSIGSASRAVMAANHFSCKLTRRNL